MNPTEPNASQISDYLDLNKNLANVERDVNDSKSMHRSTVSQGSKQQVKEPEPFYLDATRKNKSIAVTLPAEHPAGG